ncbi:proteophosphoglycan 5 [Planoprotostelium fungivorum]|uniref:Proteophosphoglycan 5 n=1 Tax=Planoprotostelium fungivorum TaxID=1890364 RepID=A0A2P6MRB9_9EUKA|nr:proteophosphoglycan 5 [Planoprotostelium fungivorum]
MANNDDRQHPQLEPFLGVKTPSPVFDDDTSKSRLVKHFEGMGLSPELVAKRQGETRTKWKSEFIVGEKVLNHEQYMKKRAEHSYTRETMLQFGTTAALLSKPVLPVLSCTVPEEYQRPQEDELRRSGNLRISSSGRRNLKSSSSGISNGVIPLSMLPPNPNVPASAIPPAQLENNLVPTGFISPRLVNRAAELTSSRSALTGSRGEIVSSGRDIPPQVVQPLRSSGAPPGFEQQSLLEKLVNAERRTIEIDKRSESSPLFDGRNKLKSSQDSVGVPEEVYAPQYGLSSSLSGLSVGAQRPSSHLTSSSSSLYINSPTMSPVPTQRGYPLSSSGSVATVFSPSVERNPIDFAAEGPPTKRGGYSIPPSEVYSPKPRQQYSAAPPPPTARRALVGSNTPIMSPSISTQQSYNFPLPYSPAEYAAQNAQQGYLPNDTAGTSQESTSFITSLLSTSTSSPAPLHPVKNAQSLAANMSHFPSQLRHSQSVGKSDQPEQW